LVVITTNISVVGGIFLALCNNDFVQIWTRGKIAWFPVNDWLLGLWFVLLSAMRAHIPLSGAIKRFGFLSYIFLIEGLFFLGLNILARKLDGITRMLMISVLCTLALTLPWIHWRTREFFSIGWRNLLGWYATTWGLAWRLLAIAMPLFFLTNTMPPVASLALNGTVIGLASITLIARYGLEDRLRTDIAEKLPNPIRRLFTLLSGREGSKTLAI
jgi:hypothetical protein